MLNKFYPSKIETVRALREIIFSIVETNINEANNIETNYQLVEKVFSTFQNKVFFENGIFVEMLDNDITVRLTVNIIKPNSIIQDLMDLQKSIYHDVFQLTGFKTTSINILVKNIILDENKKTQ